VQPKFNLFLKILVEDNILEKKREKQVAFTKNHYKNIYSFSKKFRQKTIIRSFSLPGVLVVI
jgi:hypothetical protein